MALPPAIARLTSASLNDWFGESAFVLWMPAVDRGLLIDAAWSTTGPR
jgi:hypothetical protein